MVVKNLKPLLALSFKNLLFSCIHNGPLYRHRFPVFISISYIGIIFLYLYRSPVSVLFSCIIIYDSDVYCAYYLTCYYLTPDTCLLLLNTCMLSPDLLLSDTCLILLDVLLLDICHAWYLTYNYHIWEWWPNILTYSFSTTCTHNTPDMLLLILVRW